MAATFTADELRADLVALPASAFSGADEAGRVQWMEFVLSADKDGPKGKHDIRFYTGVGRLLADVVCSTQPEDFADEYVRGVIKENFKSGDLPFTSEDNPESWRTFKITPAMVVFALRVQGKCSDTSGGAALTGESAGSGGPDDGFKNAVRDFVMAQTEQAKANVKKGLSFNLASRRGEVGLGIFPKEGLPSEELLAKWEAAAKPASDRGRLYVGSSDGDDYQAIHRPFWSRSPKIDAVVGQGSLEERLKETLDMKKARSLEEKIQYPGYASFIGHVLTWGIKLVLMKTCTQTHLLSYVFLLTRVAEEHGGAFTAYQYDLLVRKAMAQKLEHEEGDVLHFFLKLDQDLVKSAREKATAGSKKAAAFSQSRGSASSAPQTASKGGGKSNGKGGGKGGGKPANTPRPAPSTPKTRGRSRSRTKRDDYNKKGDWTKDGGWYGKSWSGR